MVEISCYDCIHCDVCSGIGSCSYHCSDASKCRYFKNKADVAPVKYGEWEVCSDEYEICANEFVCSICKESFVSSELTDEEFFKMMKYCPNCGAKMKGGEG